MVLAMNLSLPDPCVVFLVGTSGAGKSTLATHLAEANPGLDVLSYDREQGDGGPCTDEAVDRVHASLADRCVRGLATIVDGTHRQPERRARVRAVAAAHGLPVVALVLLVPLEVCLSNQRRRTRRVPPEDVRVHHAAVTGAVPMLHTEDHDVVIVLNERIATSMISTVAGSAHHPHAVRAHDLDSVGREIGVVGP
jgi:predicted kinase